MDYKITGYEPAQLFHFFEEISAIPRGSGNEKGISDFLVAFAKERGLDVYQDEVYNVIIRKPASAGAENAPTVMLQGHIDMVCDKLGSVEHDCPGIHEIVHSLPDLYYQFWPILL